MNRQALIDMLGQMGSRIVFLNFAVLLCCAMGKAAINVGETAPDFALPDQTGKIIRLSDFRGKQSVVLAFYVRAGTPG